MDKIEKRQAIERQVISKLVEIAKAHGFVPTRVFDGEEYVPAYTEAEVLDAVFAVDESRISFKHPAEDKAHVACVVLGNGGWDCIADASTCPRWDKVLEEVCAFAETLAD